jgi:hypothetical protein
MNRWDGITPLRQAYPSSVRNLNAVCANVLPSLAATDLPGHRVGQGRRPITPWWVQHRPEPQQPLKFPVRLGQLSLAKDTLSFVA